MTPHDPVSYETVAAPAATAPKLAVPPGACDAHTHVFGPFTRFPPRSPSVYALPDAGPEAHARLRQTLGTPFGVLVQPAPYANDPSAMIAAIAAAPGRLRGVASAGPDTSVETLAEWKRQGICALRFVEVRAFNGKPFPGSVGVDGLEALAQRMRETGLHAHLWFPAGEIARHARLIENLGVPVVFDHMGSPDPDSEIGDAGFQAVLGLLANADCHLKLASCRFAARTDMARVRRFHDALVEASPGRLLWGSDWPYVRMSPEPDAGVQLDTFLAWVGDAPTAKRILVDNPRQLFDFAKEF